MEELRVKTTNTGTDHRQPSDEDGYPVKLDEDSLTGIGEQFATAVEDLGGAIGGEIVVSGNVEIVVVPLTVTAALYAIGNSVGGKITIPNAMREAGSAAILQSLMLLDRSNQKPTGTILIFSSDPAAATLTDKTAFVFSTDDLKVIRAIPVTSADWVTINTKALADIPVGGKPVKATTGTSLYAAFILSNAPTFAATTDMQINFGFMRD